MGRPRRAVVIAHSDWDGVVSGLFLARALEDAGYSVELVPSDYHELGAVLGRLGRREVTVYSEVHLPEHMGAPGAGREIVVDHHAPKLEQAARSLGGAGLTGYMYDLGSGRLYANPRRGTDYSNVRALVWLAGLRPEPFERLVAPPSWLAEISDVLDNPLLAAGRPDMIETVVGYMASWERVQREVLHCGLDPACLAGIVQELREHGARLVEALPSPPEGARPVLVYAERPEDARRARLAVLAMSLSEPGRLYAAVWPTRDRYQVLLVDPRGDTALQIARSLGGGGRATAPSGTVGGATIENPEEAIHAITGHVDQPIVVKIGSRNTRTSMQHLTSST